MAEKFPEFEKPEESIIQAKTPEDKDVIFNFDKIRRERQKFYQDHNLKVEIPEIKLSEEQIKEVKTLVEKGYIDDCVIIDDSISYD